MSTFDRRRFLALGAGAVSGLWLAACSGSSGSGAADGSSTTAAGDGSSPTTAGGSPSSSAGSAAPAAKPKGRAGRRLVIVELDGGNDGMSTLVPYGMSGYRDLRQRTAIDDDRLVHLNDQLGLPTELKGLKDKGLAVLAGVGTEQPDGSHFEMMDRWWRGDVTGKAGLATGFLGRLADQMADPAARVVALEDTRRQLSITDEAWCAIGPTPRIRHITDLPCMSRVSSSQTSWTAKTSGSTTTALPS